MEIQTGILVLVFVILSLLTGAVTRHLLKKSTIPYTVALLIIGLTFGLMDRAGIFQGNFSFIGETLSLASSINPHLILFLFLPALIFEAAFAMDVHLFKRTFPQTVTLAVPGLIISTLLTAGLAMLLFPNAWTWPLALMFGAMISATDPVAVVALLKETSSRKRLETLIEGESLLNDGTAIVFFTIFYGIVVHGMSGDTSSTILNAIGEFAWVVCFGLVLGIAVGWIATKWIGKVFNDALIEITISIAAAYLVYMLAEGVFHVSGVVAIVATALVFASIGRTSISPEVDEFLHHFWEMMSYMANTIIFILVGVIVAESIRFDSAHMWLTLGLLYLGILAIRAISIGVLMPVLQRIGIGITAKKYAVLSWGGLRGAVALAMALVVAQDDALPAGVGDQILFLCAGIVVLTILINGSTMKALFRLLGMDKLPPEKQAVVDKAEANIREQLNAYKRELKGLSFFQQVNWKKIEDDFALNEKTIELQQEKKTASAEDLELAYRRRLLEAELKDYWNQFKKGLLGVRATKELVQSVEKALDDYPYLYPRKSLEKLWQGLSVIVWLNQFPILRQFTMRLFFRRINLGYNVARGFLHAEDQVSHFVSQLAPSKKVENKVRDEINLIREELNEKIEQVGTTFPEILSTLETRVAARTLLNRERQTIESLVEEGILDKPEAEKMLNHVEERMRDLYKMPAKVSPPDPEKLLRQMEWVAGLSEQTVQKILSTTQARVYNTDEILFHKGDTSKDLFIVARGAVEVYQDHKNGKEILGLLGPGAVLGEAAFITGEPRNANVKTSTPVEVLWLSSDKMKPLIENDKELQNRLKEIMKKRGEKY